MEPPELETTEPDAVKQPNGKKTGVRNLIILAVVVAGALYGFKIWTFNANHVHTDDAYVTTDVVPVTSIDPGNVQQVLVTDNQAVKAGDILVVLSDATVLTDLHQAQANLAMARAQAAGSGVDVTITGATGNAQVAQAEGGLAQSQSDIGAAQIGVETARANVTSLQAASSVAVAQYSAANDTINARQASRARAIEQVKAAQAQVVNAQAMVLSAEADVSAAQNAATYADREAQRARTLAAEGAISLSQAESKESIASRARADAETARQKVNAARAMVDDAKSQLASAQASVKEADVMITQAKSQATAARRSIDETKARVNQAQTEIRASQQAVSAAQAKSAQAQGRLKESNVVGQRIAASESLRKTAEARVKQAEAAVEKAQLAVNRTRIRARVDGIVSRRNVQIGQQVAAGQPLLAILPNQTPWVIANLKETQLAQLKTGMHVEVEVDALPGRSFRGRLDSLSQGTGSTFALLPPDNATGNFTKVVQRVPVKITLDPNQPHIEELRSGLSTNITIDLK